MSIRIERAPSRLKLSFGWSLGSYSSDLLETVRRGIAAVEGVTSATLVTTWYGSRRLLVEFAPETAPDEMLRRMAGALRALRAAPGIEPSTMTSSSAAAVPGQSPSKSKSLLSVFRSSPKSPAEEGNSNPPAVRSRFLRRLREAWFGFLALTSFGMAWVGLIVPGIPTVPFVLLTAYFAVKASPRVRHWLFQSKMFGPLMRDWKQHHAVHRIIKTKAYIFTILLIAISFAMAPASPLLYAVMISMSAFGLCMISWLPVIEEQPEESATTMTGSEKLAVATGC